MADVVWWVYIGLCCQFCGCRFVLCYLAFCEYCVKSWIFGEGVLVVFKCLIILLQRFTTAFGFSNICRKLVGLENKLHYPMQVNEFRSNSSQSGFGGLEVACWPLVPKFAASNSAEAVAFFRAKKSPACLPSEGK
jgi:hypothetical protein